MVRAFCKDPLLTIANHFHALLVAFVGLIVLSAAAFAAVEPVGFFDGIYWAITTATTTGYGDISPSTPVGKAVANALQVSGLILGAFLVAHVLDRLRQNRNEWTHEEQCELLDTQRAIAKHLGLTNEEVLN